MNKSPNFFWCHCDEKLLQNWTVNLRENFWKSSPQSSESMKTISEIYMGNAHYSFNDQKWLLLFLHPLSYPKIWATYFVFTDSDGWGDTVQKFSLSIFLPVPFSHYNLFWCNYLILIYIHKKWLCGIKYVANMNSTPRLCAIVWDLWESIYKETWTKILTETLAQSLGVEFIFTTMDSSWII